MCHKKQSLLMSLNQTSPHNTQATRKVVSCAATNTGNPSGASMPFPPNRNPSMQGASAFEVPNHLPRTSPNPQLQVHLPHTPGHLRPRVHFTRIVLTLSIPQPRSQHHPHLRVQASSTPATPTTTHRASPTPPRAPHLFLVRRHAPTRIVLTLSLPLLPPTPPPTATRPARRPLGVVWVRRTDLRARRRLLGATRLQMTLRAGPLSSPRHEHLRLPRSQCSH